MGSKPTPLAKAVAFVPFLLPSRLLSVPCHPPGSPGRLGGPVLPMNESKTGRPARAPRAADRPDRPGASKGAGPFPAISWRLSREDRGSLDVAVTSPHRGAIPARPGAREFPKRHDPGSSAPQGGGTGVGVGLFPRRAKRSVRARLNPRARCGAELRPSVPRRADHRGTSASSREDDSIPCEPLASCVAFSHSLFATLRKGGGDG